MKIAHSSLHHGHLLQYVHGWRCCTNPPVRLATHYLWATTPQPSASPHHYHRNERHQSSPHGSHDTGWNEPRELMHLLDPSPETNLPRKSESARRFRQHSSRCEGCTQTLDHDKTRRGKEYSTRIGPIKVNHSRIINSLWQQVIVQFKYSNKAVGRTLLLELCVSCNMCGESDFFLHLKDN